MILLNGISEWNTTSHGSTVLYHCNEGYRMTGPPTQTCHVTSQWNGEVPKCESNYLIIR